MIFDRNGPHKPVNTLHTSKQANVKQIRVDVLRQILNSLFIIRTATVSVAVLYKKINFSLSAESELIQYVNKY